MTASSSSPPVLCVGELLWDSLPPGLFLGGAPYNVAYHLNRLGQPAALASRVGDDRLGREALRRLQAAGLDPALIQHDASLSTGFVGVDVDANGVPEYDIVEPVAWDALALTEPLREAAAAASALVFGSLAQRHTASRETIQALLGTSTTAVLDLNLRPPFVDAQVVQASLEAADVVKLNEDELATVGAWFGAPGALEEAVPALAERFGCRLICVTQGGDGAALWHQGRWTHHEGYAVSVADTVGAGDAFLAGLLAAVLSGGSDRDALDQACRMGSFVASRQGPTPDYQMAEALSSTLAL